MPRPQTKDLFSRIGRPQIKPQAGSDAFGYMPPAAPSRSNDLTQFGAALGKMGSAAGEWIEAMAKGQMTEGEEEGLARVSADRSKSMAQVLKVANEMWKNQDGHNPFTIKSYHKNAGALFAKSDQVLDILRKTEEGQTIEDWISAKVEGSEATWSEVNQSLMNDIVTPNIQSLVDQLPESRSARELGFGRAIIPVLEQLKVNWYEHYEGAVSSKNMDTAKGILENTFDRGDFEESLKLMAPTTEEDSIYKQYQEEFAFKLPDNVDRRKFFFNTYSNNVIYNLPSESMGSVRSQAIEEELKNLSKLTNLREPVSGFKVGDYTTREGIRPYGKLRVDLEKMLIQSRNSEAAIDKANKELVTDTFSHFAYINGPHIANVINGRHPSRKVTLEASEVVKELGQFKGDDPNKMGATLFFNKPLTKEVEGDWKNLYLTDPQVFMRTFYDELKKGALKDDKGDTLTEEDFPEPVRQQFETIAASQGLIKALGNLRQLTSDKQSNSKATKEEVLRKVNTKVGEEADQLRDYIKKFYGETGFTDMDFFGVFDRLSLKSLQKLNQSTYGEIVDISKVRQDLLVNLRDQFKDFYIKNPYASRKPLYAFLNARRVAGGPTNYQRLRNLPEFQRHQVLAELNIADRSEVPTILRLIDEGREAEIEALDLNSLSVLKLMETNRTIMYGQHPLLAASVIKNPFDHGTLSPAERLMLGQSARERNLIKEQNKFMHPIYENIVEEVFETWEGDKAAVEIIKKIITETKEGPVTYKTPSGEEKQILANPLWIQFRDHVKTVSDGKFNTWDEYLRDLARKRATNNQ